jgi:hypothetical protein
VSEHDNTYCAITTEVENGKKARVIAMAKRNVVFDYYRDIIEDGDVIEAKCMNCETKIRGKVGVSSNFLTHLKVSSESFSLKICLLLPLLVLLSL